MNRSNLHILPPSGASPAGHHAPVARSSLEEHIKNTLRAALLTCRGERPLYPHLGSELNQLLFRPLSTKLKPEMKTQIRSAIQSSEPRVQLLDISLESDRSDRNKVLVDLKYQIKQTQKVERMQIAIHP